MMENPRYDRQYDITALQWRHSLSADTPRGQLQYLWVSDDEDTPAEEFRRHMASAIQQFRVIVEEDQV